MYTLCENYNLRKYSDNIALESKETTVSYSSLYESSGYLSDFYSPKALFLIVCNNTIQNYLVYHSVIVNHLVPILLSAELDEAAIVNLVEAYQPKYCWIPTTMDFAAKGFEPRFEDENGYTLFVNPRCSNEQLHQDLCQLLSTSGSTGTQKFVRQSQMNFESNTHEIAKYLDIQSDDKVITTLPLSYTYGLSVINTHILSGATVYFSHYTLMEKPFWKEVADQKITTFNGVPFTYQVIKKLKIDRLDFSSVRVFTQAGGRLDEVLQRFFGEYCLANNKRFFIMYGQAEATTRMSYLPYKEVLRKSGCVGIPFGDGQFKILGKDREYLPAMQQGDIFYSGANVCMGYALGYEDLFKGDEFNGLLDTGDVGYLDNDGYLNITGRTKRFAKLFGISINLDELDIIHSQRFSDNFFASIEYKNKIMVFSDHQNKREVLLHISKALKLPITSFRFFSIESLPRLKNNKVDFSKLKTFLN